MKNNLFILLLLAVTAGCAGGAGSTFAPAPTCGSEAECNAKWNAVEIWINHRLGRPVAERTDTTMRTHNATGNQLTAFVEKRAVGSNRWEFNIDLRCGQRIGCDPTPWEAMQSFNRAVEGAWKEVSRDDVTDRESEQ